MITNEVSNIIYCSMLLIAGGWNLLRIKQFKHLKTENELLKFKLDKCNEQRRAQCIHERC